MSVKNKLRKVWKKSKVIRPLYWGIYSSPPVKIPRDYVLLKKKDWLLFKKLPGIYDLHKTEPVNENKVLFVVYRGKEDVLNDSFQLLYDRLKEQNKYEIHVHYLHHSFVSRKEYARRASLMIEDMATAKYVFLDEANDATSCVTKRPETFVTQMWHACGAFKKFGMSTAEKEFGADRSSLLRHPNYANLDLVTVSSPEVEWAYVEAMNLTDRPQIVKATGISRTDRFYDPTFIAEAKARIYKAFPAAEGKKIILYAPTFRGRVRAAQAPDQLDFGAFAEALGDEYVLITKHHPFVKELPKIPAELKGTFAYEASGKLNIEDLIAVSDICISDYSSVVFEYSLYERPMLFYAYDIDEYNDWRGFYYPYEDMTPGPVCKTNEEMIDYILHLEERFDREKMKAFREKFMSACDGHATERIMEQVFNN